jgi:hypothetical protein
MSTARAFQATSEWGRRSNRRPRTRRRSKAIGHASRIAILERLCDRDGSPVELAKEMDEPLVKRQLSRPRAVQARRTRLVRQRPVRGAMEHTYTATVRITLTQEPLVQAGLHASSLTAQPTNAWARAADDSRSSHRPNGSVTRRRFGGSAPSGAFAFDARNWLGQSSGWAHSCRLSRITVVAHAMGPSHPGRVVGAHSARCRVRSSPAQCASAAGASTVGR